MYVNLILGLLALCLFWVLVRRIFRSASDIASPAAYLHQALEKEEGRVRRVDLARDTMASMARDKLSATQAALAEMRLALPPSLAESVLEWSMEDGQLHIRVASPEGEAEEIFVTWRLGELDIDRLSRGMADDGTGHYTVRRGMGNEESFPDEDSLTRHLAAVIAENLASGI